MIAMEAVYWGGQWLRHGKGYLYKSGFYHLVIFPIDLYLPLLMACVGGGGAPANLAQA